ncbi:hypothetical protein Q8A67_024180 [Cirrhinus molitorella]|uniref:Uncharacterized protein n=1 Tax=Cirrhinus molitorella TaxID=172907 RepID=A0AA88P2Z9_9TELE|nr:hypothetical protein Q8A67_024180 [Cirrhinus molitorella]
MVYRMVLSVLVVLEHVDEVVFIQTRSKTDRKCKGDDTFELHSVQVELEAVEKQIRQLLERQAELRAALESSRRCWSSTVHVTLKHSWNQVNIQKIILLEHYRLYRSLPIPNMP